MDNNTSLTNTQHDKVDKTTNETPSINKKVNKPPRERLLVKIFGLLTLLLLISNIYFAYQYAKFKQKSNSIIEKVGKLENTQQITEQSVKSEPVENNSQLVENYYPINTSNIVMYKNENKYPYKIHLTPNFVSNDIWRVSVNSLDDLRNIYQEASKEDCLGPCSTLIEGNNLERQFDILSKISNQNKCELDDELRKEISEFILFAEGIEGKELIDVIYNPNLKTCGLKFVAQDGYDYWLGNYEYQAGFIKDNKIIEIRFELLPIGKFKEIDNIWRDIGYNFEGGPFGGGEKMENYMENINLTDGVIKSIIDIYDSSVRSFNLIN